MSDPLAAFAAKFADAETGTTADGTPFARVAPAAVPGAVAHLRDALGYGCMRDVTVVDDPTRLDRFEVTWLFYGMDVPGWFRLKARTADAVPSIVGLFEAARWYEREVWDLFGVRFAGHDGLERIMMPDDWQGHPLRRDEPIGGEPVQFTMTRSLDREGPRDRTGGTP